MMLIKSEMGINLGVKKLMHAVDLKSAWGTSKPRAALGVWRTGSIVRWSTTLIVGTQPEL
jgi:hypothetical protein